MHTDGGVFREIFEEYQARKCIEYFIKDVSGKAVCETQEK